MRDMSPVAVGRTFSNSAMVFAGHLRHLTILLVFTLLCHQLEAAPQNPLKDPKICGRPQCELESKKFAYTDTLYKYDYTIRLRTEFSGTGENTSDLILKSNIELFFPKPCEGYLRINDVKLWDNQNQSSKTTDLSEETDDAAEDVDDYYGEFMGSSSSSNEYDFSSQHPKSGELAQDLKKFLLRFAFNDGLISEVCPHNEEAAWVLNFKKGILSAFQNTMLRFDVDLNTTETDVFGECKVHYSLESTDGVFVMIRKVKDITSCRNRHSTHSILQTTPYTFRDDKTIWPILDSQSSCNMTIDSNIYREISCFERHQLIPFSNSSTGAVTTSESTFEFKGEESYSSGEFLVQHTDLIEKRSTLLFDHIPSVKPTHSEIKASRELLKEMCSAGFPNIQREFIGVFTSFLQATKSLDYKALNELLARSASICENGKNHVLESLPYIGSTASYQVMRDQIVRDEIPSLLAHNWMTTLSFIRFPDENTLETFYTILEFSRKKLDPEYTLGASAVIHSFCRHNHECTENEKVKRIVNLLETEFLNLFNMYRGERRSRERMIVILKGLGNIGVVSPDFAAELQEIISTDDMTSIDVRLQAVQAFRRVDCSKYRGFFLETYGNFSLNSEIRIFSYLQAMRCPDYKSIAIIKKILEDEEINQVGSFVWSHLKNLAKSSSPVRIEAQGLLLNDDLSDKFKLDIRKFSRNYEHSLFFDEYNFGITTDMNLIFGTDSYLPRISNLNFTADLFGQSVNFFELSARTEGFEELVASIFGPKGPFNREVFRRKLSFLNRWLGNESSEDDDTLENLLNIDNLRLKRGAYDEDANDAEPAEEDYKFEAEEEYNEPVRKKRSSSVPPFENRKETLRKNVDDMGYNLKYNYNNPRAQIAMRVFGNDLRYISLEGIIEVMELFKNLDPFEQIAKVLSGKEFVYTKSSVFLDASYNVPLGIGLPLSIHAFGASSIDLRVSGNLERMEPVTDSWYFDVEGHFKPSISVDIITTMKSDLFYAASGIKVKSNLYSNSEVEAKLKVRGRELVSFAFNLPQDKNEIFSARSELLVLNGDEDIPQTGIEKRSSNSTCTWPVLDEAIGLKICSYFSVPDLSNSPDTIYPGLLLSGPLNFSVVLKKSDLSAKKFVFEYQWEQQNNNSDWSLVFHTPGSVVQRLLVMNVTTISDAFNASVSFANGKNRASAGCMYNGDPDDRKLDFFLDTNGNRSLNFNMELQRSQDRNAWVYKPKVLLTINGANITGLVGVIRMTEKNGISQNDFDLSFETKKLQVLLRGNLVQNEVTTSTAMTINYRFQANKIETINFDARLINTGDRSKTEYKANVQLKTSAYPKLNFASNGTWLSLQGHTEGLVTYNNAPNLRDPQYTSHVRLVFARSYSEDLVWEGSRTRASFEIKVPRSKVDFRILIKHEERSKNGTEHNVLIGVRYASDKEATGLFSVHFPRRSLFAMDTYMNVTIPEFNSCVLQLKITEKSTQDYMVNFNGSWFTGHSIGIKGNYKDRSSRVQTLHHLKLIVESPSFETTSLNIVYRRSQLLIFANVQAKYGKNPYGLTVYYAGNADNKNTNAELKLKIKDQDYWINAKLLAESPKLMQIEIHLDKFRDIHIKVGLVSLVKRKELSLEFKWDANRDPAQRLALLAEYNSPGKKKYDGNLMVTYPDRTVSCGFEVDTAGPKYYGTMRTSWGVNEIIVLKYDVGIMPSKDIHNWVHAELSTPFPGWERNSITGGVYNKGNLFLANTSLLWADNQVLELGFKSDYTIEDPIIGFDIRLGINSTIKDIPTINVKVKHWQDFKKFDTDLGLHYTTNDTANTYSLKSNWELIKSVHHQNISGTMLLITPFEGYHKGGLAAFFSLSEERNIRGAASLNFDIREFTLAMDGYVRKYTDNMLTINITTPLEKFRTINGRFGLNEKKRHAVAEVRSPTAALGVEILCDIISLMNFDVKLSVATPIEQFQQAAVFAKIKLETVDLRGMWNNATLGFTGVWSMQNLTNFEYSYMVFTPLPGFEKNGFIIKFVNRDVFILHLHGKFSTYKLGLLIDGHPKSKLLNQLGGNKIELEILYDEDFQPTKIQEDEDYDIENIDYEEFFSYFVEFEIDTLVWPTIDGVIDIQEITDFYLTVGNIQLPQGRVDVKDRLYFPDYLNVLNVLTIKTPFPKVDEVKSIVEYHVDLDFKYFYQKVHFVLDQNMEIMKEMGFELNYTKIEDTLKPKQHNVKFTMKTPYEVLKELDVMGSVELEENIYRGNISSRTSNTYLSLATSVETEENFLETSVGILLNTNVIPHYGCNVYFKKDFSSVDNSIEIQFEVADNDTVNRLQIECDWHKNPINIINANGKVKTTMLPLKLAETSILITKGSNPSVSFDLGLLSRTGYRIDYGTRANKKRDVFNVEIWTPIKNFRNISMHGSILSSPSNPQEYKISGHMYRNMATYNLNGIIRMSDNNYPADTRLRVQPKAGGRDGVIELSINEQENGQSGLNFQFSAIEDGKMCQISGGYSITKDMGVDFSALVQSTEPDISRININGKLKPQGRGHIIGEITLETPWQELGIESVKLRSDLSTNAEGGHVLGEYKISKNIGRGSCTWSWILAENMQLILESYVERPSAKPRVVHASAKYVNPHKNFRNLQVGGKLSVDSKWNLDINSKVNYLTADDVQCALVTQLPSPIGDVHELNLRYQGNLISQQGVKPKLFFEGQYQSKEAKRTFLTRLSYQNETNLEGLGHVEWGVSGDTQVVEADLNILRKGKIRRDFTAKLTTPKYRSEPTVHINGHYDQTKSEYHNVYCTLDYPATHRIADMDISFLSLSNMHGQINSSTPFFNVTWLKTDFNFSTTGSESYRYCQGTWPTDTAFFKLHSTYTTQQQSHNLQGNIEVEVPLTTRHRSDITYGLDERENNDKGYLKVIYNEKQVLNGIYKRRAEHQHPHHTETTDITLENDMKPIGIYYKSSRDMSNPNVNKDTKHVEVFELRNTKNFNLTGELHTLSRLNGQDFKIVVIHPNRTVVITTHYEEVDEHLVRQKTKLELSPTAWIGYKIELGNYTTAVNDSQNFFIELFYPKRTLSTQGRYYMVEDRFQSNVSFKWSLSNDPSEIKSIDTSLRWQGEPLKEGDRDHQTILFTLNHPYLEKEVNVKGLFYRGVVDLLKTQLVIDYSKNPEHMISVNANLVDQYRKTGHTLYLFTFFVKHPASELDVELNSSIIAKPSYYKTESYSLYRRDYYPDKRGKFLVMLDMNKREVEYIRNTPFRSVRFWAIPNIHYPVYGVNATIWDTPETNNTGYIYVDLHRKVARMEFNLTEDASQNLQMVGYIPDTRSGFFDIWRNYEEIRIIDVTSYVKMNHSRLVTGRFHWRPKIQDEIKYKIKAVGNSLYNSISDGIDFWIKSVYSESIETMGVIWDKTKEYNEEFFDDISQLSVLEEDLKDLRLFVNQSYEANDFYIKTMVNFTITILDELALRDHIQSLPKIITEIWQSMGDSGKALRNSVIWLLNAIKTTYNNVLDAISRFFHGESLQYLSALMEKGVKKYDKFVKDLHISFIKYVEKLWNKFWNIISNYWKSVLKRMEPHIFRFMSYIETAAWNLSKEVFDFIYKRTNELAESPYFNKVSSFTQDLDRLYKDIKSNDAITNIKKYTLIAWKFIKEKYFKLVPFGAELNEVLTEIWEEIKELQKIDQVQVVIQKYEEIMAKLDWIAEELDMETRLHQLYALLRNKFRNYAMNALETADMYREAKTKFIFDPEVGIIDLEQKLPMSWHAFNETPKFEEIPEYKFLAEIQNVFSTTNSSIVRYIYNLRSHLDPKTWLPPYYSRALLIDSRHYMTFDNSFVGLNLRFEEKTGSRRNAQCSYLLAHDFFQRNFTLMLEPASSAQTDIVSTRKLSFIISEQLVEIDLGNDQITVNGDSHPMLPLRIEDVTIFRDFDVLSVQSNNEFSLNCNVQFGLCWLELSGWYFGKTAGILGTMNNEHFDEYTTSKNSITKNVEELTDSWSVQKCVQKKRETTTSPKNGESSESQRVFDMCHLFFKSGMLSACSATIDSTPFYEICLDLGINSNPIRPGHPALKGACTAALAYIEACTAAKVPLRVPDQCVFCQLANGSYVPEATFIDISGSEVPRSTDVVFIVEAKLCNENLTQNKNLMTVVAKLEEELRVNQITENRYAVVTFGGLPPFDRPRSIIYENRVFTKNLEELERYFSHIEVGNGTNNDILQAISAASRLNFRPGVSKTFILLSCSGCAAHSMRFDYTSILQYMLEEGVNLHILADVEFDFERTQKLRHFFGLDRELVYSRRFMEGNAKARKQLHIPRGNLGICTPLALETNGSVFSARKLLPDRKIKINPIQFATIFAKRVARSAVPIANQTCECSGHNTGVAYMTCSPSAYPDDNPAIDDYDLPFNEADWDSDFEDDKDFTS